MPNRPTTPRRKPAPSKIHRFGERYIKLPTEGWDEAIQGKEAMSTPPRTPCRFEGIISGLTNGANRPRLHRGAERSRGSEKLREGERQCRRGPS
jgi:hypothetical protein